MGDIYPRFTVAAVQAASVLLDREKTVDKAIRLIEEAADKGAVIIGFPELFIAGHLALWFNGKKSNPLLSLDGVYKELVKNGVRVPSPEVNRLCTAAKKAHAYIVMGITEVDMLFPGTLYMSQLFISDTGEIMGVHRKLMPSVYEKLIYSRGDGSYLDVFDSPYGKLSSLCCGEHNHDLYKYALLSMGTQIHIASWPAFPEYIYGKLVRDAVDYRLRQFAREGQIFILNCCGITDEQNIDYCCDTQEEKDNIVENSGAGSSIIGPNGEHLAGPTYEGEVVLTAEISLEDALSGKIISNVTGDYTRWDVLSLHFNRERLSPFKNTSIGENNQIDFPSELQEIKREIYKINQRLDKLTKEPKLKG